LDNSAKLQPPSGTAIAALSPLRLQPAQLD
jgi:hypothetical protein